MPNENGTLTREERIELLRKRTKRDGTPFAKHEGPRKARKVSADGLAVALSVLESDSQKIKVIQSFGLDGRKALKSLVNDRPELKDLYDTAFPRAEYTGTSAGRPYANSVRATTNGHAVISGFTAGHAVHVLRNADGTVTLTQGEFIAGRMLADSPPAAEATA